MKKTKLILWEENNSAYAELRLTDEEENLLYQFRNILSEDIKNVKNLEIIKDEGYPTKFDSNYILFGKDVFEEAKEKLELLRKEYPETPVHPGIFSFIFKTKKHKEWKKFQEKLSSQEKKTWSTLEGLLSVMIETNHDYPYLNCCSKIHSIEDLVSSIEKVAKDLNIELEIINKKPI